MIHTALRLAAILLLLVLLPAGPARSQLAEIRIADSRGDWGPPSPYLHYPRGPGYIRMSWIFDTLIWKDREGFIPALADSWEFNPQELSYTFNLNPEAQWHDGRPLTAADVAFTIELFQRHPYYWVNVDHIDHSEVTGPHQVVIRLQRPYAPFLADVAGTMPILPEHIWREVADPTAFRAPEAFIGSGPYRLADYNPTQGSYLYLAFADYHRGAPKAQRLIYLRSGQPMVSLGNRQADLAQISPEMVAPLRNQGLKVIQDEGGWNKKLMINHRRAPFDDRRFRQALAHAIDRREIIAKSQRGHGRPASYGLLSEDHPWYNPELPEYPPDPELTRALLTELGFSPGRDGFFQHNGRPLQVELLVSNITASGQSAPDRDGEVIKMQLERAGIKVALINLEQATTDQRVRSWNFDLALSGHGGISGDARILNEMISSQHGAGSVNSARFDQNQELNRLLEEQLLAMDPEERRRIVGRIQELHAMELPAIPLYYPDSYSAYHPARGIEWFYTRGGIGKGIPIAQNKVSLLNCNHPAP